MILHHEHIVIGGGLDAAMLAYAYDLPLYFTHPAPPFRFDCFPPDIRLSSVGIPSERKKLNTLSSSIEVGIPKSILWERLMFLLSLDGRLPLSNLCDIMRYDGEKVTCTNEYAKIHEFSFDKCYYFGDTNVSGIVSEEPPTEPSYICYDYIAFHKGGKHEIDYIPTGDDFVSEIWFHSSDRIDGNTGVKDACVVSALTEEELYDPNFSETMARFKMEKTLYDNGMRGPLNGYTSKGTPRHYRFKTSHLRRFKKLSTPLQWEETPSIQRSPLSADELLALIIEKDLATYKVLKCDYTLPA